MAGGPCGAGAGIASGCRRQPLTNQLSAADTLLHRDDMDNVEVQNVCQ